MSKQVVKQSSNLQFELDNNKVLRILSAGPKYLLMSRIESEETLKGVSPFLIKKIIDCVCGEIEMCQKLRSGDLLIKTKTATQATKLIQIITLTPDIKVKVTEHSYLNYTKGVIYSNGLRGISEEEILAELKQQNVIEVKKILKKVEEELVETGLVIITFSTITLPDSLKIGYETANVRPYIPLPMICLNCQRFGHSSKYCKNNRICNICCEEEHLSEEELCPNTVKCINCEENNIPDFNHSVRDRKCPVFLKQKEIQAIKSLNKVDNKTAVKIYKQRHPSNVSISNVTRKVITYDTDEQPSCSNNTKPQENKIETNLPPSIMSTIYH
ncbi:uncharacterized protein [Musca autumnalis]|uniref:uncharacterized protein n=1 Tax=Musca autumnalis TaxID=221902 RepID=UPI003CF347C7